ncbi:hypothetical protein OZK63_39730, partial [Streptomyces sp. UMAF16]|nr:hypothetical protein [Streptomyces sp. UMAF16]
KLSESYHCDALFIAPGNTGTQQYGSNVSLSLNDFNSIRNFWPVRVHDLRYLKEVFSLEFVC